MNAYDALLQTEGACVLFESTSGPGPRATTSLLARTPCAILVTTREETHVSPLQALRHLLAQVPANAHEGGIAGAIAYDVARPGRPAAATPLIVALAVERFERFDPQPRNDAISDELAPPLDLAPFSSMTRGQYVDRVRAIQEHIAAGDIYQANLSQRFQLPWKMSGLRVYGHLRHISPAPFAGYLRLDDVEIVSASPERLLCVDGDRLSARPIAGTRPRVTDQTRDRALAAELLLNEKERAEHLMLVDLARNDLGRVAATGSVHVDELMSVEDYSHVRHIVSNVSARLATGYDALDALMALFPGGTITGVPKRRCMEILDDIEPVPRGFYTGALFYLTRSGRLDANILIRSAVVHGGQLTFHTGAGIVADSDPDREYEETLDKAEGLRLAIAATLSESPAC